jgi:hypothetical protein
MLDYRTKTFLTVCKTLNFTTAAKQLNITQPAVSQHEYNGWASPSNTVK